MSALDCIYHAPSMEELTELCHQLNKHFCEGKFNVINKELMTINCETATLEGLSATLRYTFCAKEKLPYWKCFRDAVYNQCLARDGNYVDFLLKVSLQNENDLLMHCCTVFWLTNKSI